MQGEMLKLESEDAGAGASVAVSKRRASSYIGLRVEAHLMHVREASEVVARSPEEVYRELSDMGAMAQESVQVLTVNARNRIIARHLVTLGLLDACPMHPREVFRPAILDGASGVILAHNHPSGDCTPSAEDIRMTRAMIEAGRVLCVRLMDHLIIGRGARPWLSMREQGLCDFSAAN